MKIFFNYSQDKFLNSYLVVNEKNNQALLIDPLKLSMETINLIEKHNVELTHILFTHGDKAEQREGILSTAKVYSSVKVMHYEYLNETLVETTDEKNFQLLSGDSVIYPAGLTVECFSLSGMGSSTHCFKIENIIFCGDALLSGKLASTTSAYAAQNLQKTLKEKIFTQEKSLLLFPRSGGPTSIAVETIYNQDLKYNFSERNKAKITSLLR